MNIKGLDKAKVLLALYKHSRSQGMSFLGAFGAPLTEDDCRELLKKQTCFDYLGGRVMKISLAGDYLDTRLYDRDNGCGAAEFAIMEELTRPD